MTRIVPRTGNAIQAEKINSAKHGSRKTQPLTLTEQGINVDKFIQANHTLIQHLRHTSPRNTGEPVGEDLEHGGAYKPREHVKGRDLVYQTFKRLSNTSKRRISSNDIAQAIGMPRSTVRYHLHSLYTLGLMDRHGYTWTLTEH